MRITLHAIGKRMPGWISEGFEEYRSRLANDVSLELRQYNMPQRSGNSVTQRLVEEEGRRMLAGVENGDLVIALDQGGRPWSSEDLAGHVRVWREQQQSVSLLVGGPDGLSRSCLDRAGESWSLSRMTLPHMLVRVVVAEQLYRAWAILKKHPYHR